MKIQSKSLLSSLAARSSARTASTPARHPTANLQALASELHQSATQGLFEYPRNWVLMSKVAAVLLMSLAALQVVRLMQPILKAAAAGTPIERVGITMWQIAATGAGVVLAFALAALLLNLFPTVKVTPHGLGISELFGWRRVTWNQVGVLRVMEMGDGERYALMIPFKGATQPPTPAPILRLIPRLSGVSLRGERGIIVTSHISNFDRMVQLMVSYMAQAAGQSVPRVELFVDETSVMPLAQLVLAPEDAIVRMARQKKTAEMYGMPTEDESEPDLVWSKIVRRQLLIALPAPLLLLIGVVNQGWGATITMPLVLWSLVLIGFGLAELPFAAKLMQTVGDMVVGSGQLKRSVWAYLELQAPRAMLAMVGVVLVGAGLPTPVAQVCWLAGIGITTWLTVRFVQRLYFVPIAHTLMAGLGVLIYQVVLLAMYYGLS